jgi:hypothetical protein
MSSSTRAFTFGIRELRSGAGRKVTFPTRQRRSFALLRPITGPILTVRITGLVRAA